MISKRWLDMLPKQFTIFLYVFILINAILAGVSSAQDFGISNSGHYFTYAGKTRLILNDSGTQCVMQNLNIDFRAWVDAVAGEGHSGVHIWAFVAPRQKLDGSEIESRYGYVYPGATPWLRKASGPDAYDGGRQWDLFSFDEGTDPDLHYWPRLRNLCQRLQNKGMTLGITVFFGWPKEADDFKYHPFSYHNGGPALQREDITHIHSPGVEIHTLPWEDSWPTRRKTQWLWEKYALKLITETAGFDNIWFDFRDEWSYDNDTNMERHFRDFFMRRGRIWADRTLSADFRVMNPTLAPFGSTPAMKVEGGPYDHDGLLLEAWEIAMSGRHYLLHDDSRDPGITAWDPMTAGIRGIDPHNDPGRRFLGYASIFFNEYLTHLDYLVPSSGLASTGYCLAFPGLEYAVFSPPTSSFNLDLTAVEGSATAKFYDVRTGTMQSPFAVDGGGVRTFTPPDPTQPWALHVLTDYSGNYPPVGADSSVWTPADTPVSVVLPGSDVDGDVLTYAFVSSPVWGTLSSDDGDSLVVYTPAAGFVGSDSFTYQVSDGLATSASARISITVVAEDGQGLIGYWPLDEGSGTNASDASDFSQDGVVMGATWTSGWTGSALSFDGIDDRVEVADNGLYDFGATASFSYGAWILPRVIDGTGRRVLSKRAGTGSEVAGFDLVVWNGGLLVELSDGSVEAHNGTPVPLATGQWQHVFVTVDRTLSVAHLYVDGMQRDSFGLSALGSLASNSPLVFGQTANGGRPYNGLIDKVRLYDRALSKTEVTALIDSNEAPVAVNDIAQTGKDVAIAVDVLGNDTDADGDPLFVVEVTTPANGTVIINADETVTYTPAAGFVGSDSFTYQVSDGLATSASARISITVVAEDGQGLIGYWPLDEGSGTNASDASDFSQDGVVMGATWTSGWTGSALSFDGIDDRVEVADNGLYDFGATASFSYGAWILPRVIDGTGRRVLSKRAGTGSEVAGFDLVVWNGGLLVELSDGSVEAHNGTPVPLATGQWQHVFVTVDRTLSVAHLYVDGVQRDSFGLSALGSLASNSPLVFGQTANGGRPYNGLIDKVRLYDRALSKTEVTALIDSNEAPVAVNDIAQTGKDVAIAVDVLGNDTDADGDPLFVVEVTTPANGTVIINADETVTYTPAAGFVGSDSFSYRVSDGNETDTAQVTVTANAVNEAPVALDGSAATAEDLPVSVVLPGSDMDGDVLTYAIVSSPVWGTLSSDDGDSLVVYTPAAGFVGSDSFTYQVSDGLATSASARISITVVAEDGQGLIGYWPLDEGSGTNASDASDFSQDGVVMGATWTSGWTGSALSFDGIDDRVEVADNGLYDFGATASFSYGAWILPRVIDGTGRRVLSKRAGTGSEVAGFDLVVWNGGLLVELSDGSVEAHNGTPVPLATGQWQHVFVTVDRTLSVAHLYVDGVQRDSFGLSALGSLASNSPLVFGQTANGGRPYNGLIDKVRLYDRALSKTEVTALIDSNEAPGQYF